MTPMDRATKIVDWLNPTRIVHTATAPSLLEQMIAAQIEEAVQEAVAERGHLFQENVAKFPDELKQAKAEGFEQAAQIADSYPLKAGLTEAKWATPDVCCTIANQIRARAKEIK